MLLVVSAPKAFQRKLVDVVDRNTTRQVKINQPGETVFRFLRQPSRPKLRGLHHGAIAIQAARSFEHTFLVPRVARLDAIKPHHAAAPPGRAGLSAD